MRRPFLSCGIPWTCDTSEINPSPGFGADLAAIPLRVWKLKSALPEAIYLGWVWRCLIAPWRTGTDGRREGIRDEMPGPRVKGSRYIYIYIHITYICDSIWGW